MFALLAMFVTGVSVLGATPSWSADALQDVTGKLRTQMSAKGRAEVQLERRETDPLTGKLRTAKGQLALEPPAFARIDFAPSGEQVAVREDGGEWIQPGLEQMIRIPGERLAGVLRWWRLFAGADADRFHARKTGERHYVVWPKESPADSARIRLGKSGLPYELEIDEGLASATVYRLSGWKFVAARGRPAFVLTAPEGYEVVDLP
jgi:outer membrane lipoprotein-sorting protein